jgi:hypothetical protein
VGVILFSFDVHCVTYGREKSIGSALLGEYFRVFVTYGVIAISW